ncbi:PhzF family phenazine biosynthesis protein [Azorhizobium sp. AG788]|uniref:PhzF family phenazine biosynthesis protein n=1 Tax=Azorhizobium sp. AG788 TaxID=2183897 RepID=UPI00105DE206|nr:PhzF family phenazine biosynthesis protein [Azorhizobium sp. AG788]TDT92547.1 PhzF family phenazine biosynthesis protein [Azorhizobium sp. AG788]
MKAPLFQVDAFTTRRFAGNPAAVMLLEAYPEDETLRAIAAENNLSETAFLVREGGDYHLRWFTPKVEVPLCGHATLASASVVMERLEPGRASVTFHTASGALPVSRSGTGYVLDFPARGSEPIAMPGVAAALGAAPEEVRINPFTYMAVLADAATVRGLSPDMAAIAALDRPGLIVTAPGDNAYDVVSRYFAPAKGIPEDPVTGAAHTTLVPYWAERLGRSTLACHQASARGGDLTCRLSDDRVLIEGACVFFLEGTAEYGTETKRQART